jgi:hypothetical protein
MQPKLPSKIGAELILLAQSPEVLRWLNWHGFEVSRGDGSSWRLRRWRAPGAVARDAKPYCPAGTVRLIVAA